MSRRRITSQQATTVLQMQRSMMPDQLLYQLYQHARMACAELVPQNAIVTVRIEFEVEDEE